MASWEEFSIKDLTGRNVIIRLNNPEGGEIEGKADTVSELGILLKPKGRARNEIVMADNILDLELLPEREKEIKQRAMRPTPRSSVKQHLVDRHGYRLADINAMTTDFALAYHEELDHSEIGHNHALPMKSAAEEKVEAIEAAD